MKYVLDAQTALRWHFEDETTEEDEILLDLFSNGWQAVVPSIFFFEVANVVVIEERRKSPRSSQAQSESFLADLAALPIELDPTSTLQAWNKTASLARQFNLSAYDAAYLEAAMRFGLSLASRDTDLVKTAKQSGVKLVFPLKAARESA